MGGKGRKRREKNYRAAHGGHTRLPPPPDPSQVDALPSKLRNLMAFASLDGSSKVALEKRKIGDVDDHKKGSVKNMINEETKRDYSEIAHSDNTNEKRKKKRKRKQVSDLRFETVELDSASKRKERKKKYFEEKKNKKKAKIKDDLDFPGHERIKFGEVVEAPPKLAVIPKAFKSAQNASQERRRAQAIEAYRNRKGWSSRPGLSPPVTTPL